MDEASFWSQVALELDAELGMTSTAELITRYACLTTAADESGVLTVPRRNAFESAAASTDRVAALHDLQVSLLEGPCVEAILQEHHYVSGEIVADARWPRWGPAAADLGIRSVLSVRLESKNRRVGALNLYAESPDAFTAKDLTVALNFGRHASIAISSAFSEQGHEIAIGARTYIGQAQGILMGRYGIGADLAHEYLRRRSQQENVKLVDVAHLVIDELHAEQAANRSTLPDGPGSTPGDA